MLGRKALDEALRLLAQHGDDARVLAGGQSLMPTLNMRLSQPKLLIDINRIAELERNFRRPVARCASARSPVMSKS